MALLFVLSWTWPLDRPASAQAGPTFDPRQEARMRLGPLYVTPMFLVRDVGVDTNVFDSTVQPVSDFTFTAVPRADAWVPFARRGLLTTSTAASLVYYHTYSAARSIDPDSLVRGEVYARRLTFFAENRYFQTRERTLEVDAALARRSENGSTAGAAVRIGTRTLAEVAPYRRRVTYDDATEAGASLRDALNRVEDGVRVTVRQKITPFTTILVGLETQRAQFEFSPVRDTDGVRIMPGVEFSPRALISGRADVGYRQFTGDFVPTFRGVVARTALNYTLLEATQFGVTWDRDAIPSFDLLWPYAVLNAVGGRVRRQIRGQFDAIASAQRATYDFRSFNGLEQNARHDVTVSYTVDVGYRVGRDARVGVAVTTWNRTSTELLRGYHDVRVGVSVAYAMPR